MRVTIKIITIKIFSILLLFSTQIIAANYYLDSKNGDNSKNGLSPENAWKTISKLSEVIIQPGDSILLRRGMEWDEEFIVSFSGEKENPIVISAYGEGNKPLIKGSIEAKKWRKHSNIVWQSDIKQKPDCIWLVDEDKTIHWGIEKESINALSKNYDFIWQDSVLYLYLGRNPSKIFPEVECSVREFGIVNDYDKMGQNYITIENLEIAFANNADIRAIGVKGWVVKNCILHHSGIIDESDGQGIQYEGEDGLFTNNIIYENGQHGIFISSFGTADVANNIIEKNTIYNNYHTGIDLMNDGGDENSHRNTIVRQNLLYDTDDFKGNEVGIQTLGYGNGMVKNVVIHHNIVVNLNGCGISAVPNSDSIFIHNNTVYEPKSSCINMNNGNYYCEAYNNIGIDHIYYAPFFIHNSYNKKADYNIWNTDQVSFVFIDGEYPETWQQYIDKYKLDQHGSNKLLEMQLEGKIPKVKNKNAICIDKGKDLGYKYDFFGNPIDDKPDIGAVEFK